MKNPAPTFQALWPTHLMRWLPSGSKTHNPALLSRILAEDGAQAQMTLNYRKRAFFDPQDAARSWLEEAINQAVTAYVHHLKLDYRVSWHLQAWANVNRQGDYHSPHNHPFAYLSGSYYIEVPPAPDLSKNRADIRPGAISFLDPRGAVNMMAIRGDPQNRAEHRMDPEPGLLVLWPAQLNHYVHPNLSATPRVSVSFNAVLKWSDDYLPKR